jgi:hypothetical protein
MTEMLKNLWLHRGILLRSLLCAACYGGAVSDENLGPHRKPANAATFADTTTIDGIRRNTMSKIAGMI